MYAITYNKILIIFFYPDIFYLFLIWSAVCFDWLENRFLDNSYYRKLCQSLENVFEKEKSKLQQRIGHWYLTSIEQE